MFMVPCILVILVI